MDLQLSGNTSRGTRQAQQKGGQNPVWQRPFALVYHGVGQIVEGSIAAITPVAFAPWSIVIIAPRIDVVTLAAGTLEGPIFPP